MQSKSIIIAAAVMLGMVGIYFFTTTTSEPTLTGTQSDAQENPQQPNLSLTPAPLHESIESVANPFISEDGRLSQRMAGFVISDQVAQLRAAYAQFIGDDVPLLDELTKLTELKIQQDANLAMTDGGLAYLTANSSDQGQANDQFDPAQQVELKLYDEQLMKFEENRIDFEDAVHDLLSPEQLRAFQAFEQQRASMNLRQQSAMLAVSFKIGVGELSADQQQKLDAILESQLNESLEQVPLGSTIGDQFSAAGSVQARRLSDFESALISLLSTEQRARYEASPLRMLGQ
ncbi:hypothetical protein [Arenicella xantha]|uniref:Uncharacterized protein n=1 Tax=Arenicella xantha TaxID=644221 RepID=A0A395JTD5_9GAMM|nr:hypothetical protein [Arenicella xantha]RBP52838.1 hypothetical protein DFR28_101222 [Arenicella xantha]